MGRQRNSQHVNEKQASPKKEVNEIEASNLSEKEFREMVMRWLKRMEDKFNNMSKNQEEMKKNQEEMKNDIAAVKNSIESIKSRLEEAEDRISELEDKHNALPSIFESLQKERVEAGDVIYIEANSGAIKRQGRCDTYDTEFNLEAEEYVLLPKGDVYKEERAHPGRYLA
ncbi:hypothetical protein QTO34_000403 [Cnephaeus nilssonii]|uniref:RuvB-like helicase n=1 Tax=Cnephaeus nilssonii TaxID=3371016 RepID=A0AA40LWX1_CNENI|nr:hypothetical protein QTO34_000403 [Eptesicus nilssonii]